MEVYSMGLHASMCIFIQTHYILWKHPVHRGGAMRVCPTPIGTVIQDRAYGLRRIHLPRTLVNRGKKKDRNFFAPALPIPRRAPFLERRSSTSRRTLQGGQSLRVHLSLRGLFADR